MTLRRPGGAGNTSFTAPLRVGEFRALWAVDALSIAGDQFARVALAVLVYGRTGSTLATAGVYALTFLPTLVGGALLSGLADRFPRRQVMVACDLGRAGLLALMAMPGLPLAAVATLLVAAVLLGAPFRAAQVSLLPDVLPGELYAAGLALRSATLQLGQLAGYALGGLVVALVDTPVALLVDAATFAVSAIVVAVWVRDRPAARADSSRASSRGTSRPPGWWTDTGAGVRGLLATPATRISTGLLLLSAFYIVPESLAAPYAASLGGGAAATGLLLAADPAGAAVGAWWFVHRLSPAQRDASMAVLAILPGLALALCLTRPGLALTLVLWVASGLTSGYVVQTSVVMVRDVPNARRGRVMGFASALLLAVQGLGALLAGLIGQQAAVSAVVGGAGLAGAGCAGALAWRWRRAQARARVTAPGDGDVVAEATT